MFQVATRRQEFICGSVVEIHADGEVFWMTTQNPLLFDSPRVLVLVGVWTAPMPFAVRR